jgi:hypothetical protein
MMYYADNIDNIKYRGILKNYLGMLISFRMSFIVMQK